MPPGVHLAVVDPEVGARRRAVALRTADEDRLLVGPDNGLLMLAAERFGGVRRGRRDLALEVAAASRCRRRSTAATCSRRWRRSWRRARSSRWPASRWIPTTSSCSAARRARLDADGAFVAEVVAHRFASATSSSTSCTTQLADSRLKLGHPVALEIGGRSVDAVFARAFADVAPGEVLLYEDASRTLAIAVNTGDAAEELLLRAGDEVRIVP